MELKYRCELCGMETVNPTRVHVCPECSRRICSECLVAHRSGHQGTAPGPA